jgi:ERCC4-type nuclease
MIILCDSREQLPLEFQHPFIEGVERSTLSTGDYGVRFKDNHHPPIYFERKSIPDLIGTLGRDYKRFKKEIMRSKDNKSELIIIIEGTVTDVIAGTKYSKIDGLQILRTLLSIWNRYQIVSVFCKDRKEVALFIAEYYLAYARKRTKEERNVKEGHSNAL